MAQPVDEPIPVERRLHRYPSECRPERLELRDELIELVVASSATDAEAALLTFEPEILITDIEMPGNDGISLLHSLRGRRSAAFPALAVSGYADDASRTRVLAAGFNGFVAKPLDPALLADEIIRALTPP